MSGSPIEPKSATVVVDPAFVVGPVRPALFGSFVEHMGRCVYGGIYEPTHPTADGEGFRRDVADLVGELGVTAIRYPGGNFVSGYDWEDGIGPREQRPARLDRAWRAIESNAVGTDDFLQWAERIGVEPVMAVNLGTRGVQEACDLLEYVNRPAGTKWADRRVANGRREPYGVRRWCLGNEMDGPWQIGHKTADEYGRLAAEVARAMRRIDPGLELIASGSSNSAMPTFGAWEATMLEHCYDLVDSVSVHAYYQQHGDDRASFLASAVDMDHIIERVAATADAVGAQLRNRKRLQLAFDEWNVWYYERFVESELAYEQARSANGQPAPLIEDTYDAVDAVVVGSLLISLLQHADRVELACLAQLVNVIAPIRAEPGGPAWRQAIFGPFAATARAASGEALQTAVDGPAHETERYGWVPSLHAVATHDADAGALAVFLVNRSVDTPLAVTVEPRGLGPVGATRAEQLSATDPGLTNGPGVETVHVGTAVAPAVADGALSTMLPPMSWTVLQVELGHPDRRVSR